MKSFHLCILLFAAALLLPLGYAADAAAEDSPIRVLILTGKNNHNWKDSTPVLQKILEEAKCEVETTVPPEGLTAENLKRFDVILSNWNSWGRGKQEAEAAWTDEVRKAYLDAIRGGAGHVTVHAGGCSFYKDWPEYRKVVLVWWELGKTGHGRQHEFEVRVDKADHPVAAGLKTFKIRDELWNRPGIAEGATLVGSAFSDKQSGGGATGEWEPSTVTATYGKGRCFATLLGHDGKIMENEHFQDLLIRGVRWAAGREVKAAKK